jgi:hypothetical protein
VIAEDVQKAIADFPQIQVELAAGRFEGAEEEQVDLRTQAGVSGSVWSNLNGFPKLTFFSLADLKIYGPGGAGDPAPAPADPTRYTCESNGGIESGISSLTCHLVVPWEEVNAALAASSEERTESPPPTFATATASANALTDKRGIVNDTAQGEMTGLGGK